MDVTPERRERISKALAMLEPTTPEHWKADGRPQVSAVMRFAKMAVTKDEIDAIDPHLTRESALRQAEVAVAEILGERGVPAVPSPSAGALPETPPTPPVTPASVLDRPFADVVRDPELLARAREELDERLIALTRERGKIDAEIERLSALSQIADRYIEQQRPEDGFTAQVKAVQKRAHEERAAKAANARKFVAAGTTRDAVLATLDPRAPVDRALNARRGSPGSRRPTPVTPAHLRQ